MINNPNNGTILTATKHSKRKTIGGGAAASILKPHETTTLPFQIAQIASSSFEDPNYSKFVSGRDFEG
jgi:hypothetical protein